MSDQEINTETAKRRAKPKAKPVVKPETNHTIQDLNVAGRNYKSAVQDMKFARHRNSIKRLSAEDLGEAILKVEALREAVFKMHIEYLEQDGIDKSYATKHLKALQNVQA